MPELPEVERSRRLLERTLVGKKIVSVHAEDDDKVFANMAPKKFAAHFRGKTVVAVHRKGKHLIVEVKGRGPNVYFHQGMTGDFSAIRRHRNGAGDSVVKIEEPLLFQSFKVDTTQWPPRFTKCTLTTSDGAEVAFTNSRRFGRIRAVDSLFDDDARFAKLGPDAFHQRPTATELAAMFAKRKAPIKAVLLDQVGRWVSGWVRCKKREERNNGIYLRFDFELHVLCSVQAKHTGCLVSRSCWPAQLSQRR